ncbi:hypothetical protein INR49_029339 [Caranx melampygus]|nr:hypothetical protein INR49_029339 [Caranx melampygus]
MILSATAQLQTDRQTERERGRRRGAAAVQLPASPECYKRNCLQHLGHSVEHAGRFCHPVVDLSSPSASVKISQERAGGCLSSSATVRRQKERVYGWTQEREEQKEGELTAPLHRAPDTRGREGGREGGSCKEWVYPCTVTSLHRSLYPGSIHACLITSQCRARLSLSTPLNRSGSFVKRNQGFEL